MPFLVVLIIVALVLGIWTLATIGALIFWLLPGLLAGLLVGWLSSLVTNSRVGTLGLILVGVLGSFVGGAVLTLLGFRPEGGPLSLSHLFAAFVGAVILLALFGSRERAY